MSTKVKDTNTCQTCPKDRIARRMIGTTTMNTTITYGPVVDLQPPHVVGGQQTFAVVGNQGIRQTTGRNAHAIVAAGPETTDVPPDRSALRGPIGVLQLFVPVFGMLARGRGMVHQTKLAVAAANPLPVFVKIDFGRVHASTVATAALCLRFALFFPTAGLCGIGFVK